MIKATFGLTKAPFNREAPELIQQQKEILEIIKIHAQHGGFSVVIASPGVGKSILREHIEAMDKEKSIVVVSFSRTMHTYQQILKQLAASFKIDAPDKDLENALTKAAFGHIRDRRTLYTLIDEEHLLKMTTLRKLRLLFDQFPKNIIWFYLANNNCCITWQWVPMKTSRAG
jgi:MSHA biogenesis protein MshM